ncbi:MAG: hypothetical protein JSC161_000278 [Candidatus Tokpelaia sp. JSC161]|nr:MAG: hypothetical protein JSC161_000278 [Candidatus Tokpelaia sp. JSC161]
MVEHKKSVDINQKTLNFLRNEIKSVAAKFVVNTAKNSKSLGFLKKLMHNIPKNQKSLAALIHKTLKEKS